MYEMEGNKIIRGDKVFCIVFGEGVVQNTANGVVYVSFGQKMISYTKSNRGFKPPRFHARTLYWSNPEFIAPVPSPDDRAAKILTRLFANAHQVITEELEK